MASSTRRASPVRPGRPKLERRVEPIYSAVAVDNSTTGTVTFFQDAVGGNGNTLLHTNMKKAGSLPTPRVFDITGFELHISQALTSKTAGRPANEAVANQTTDFFNGLKGLLYTTFVTFTVGTKDYVQSPAFLLPSNQFIDGKVFGAQVPNGTFANGLRIAAGQSCGMSWSTAKQMIRLVPDQSFRGAMTFPIAGAGQVSGAGHLVSLFLHGLHWVEVM